MVRINLIMNSVGTVCESWRAWHHSCYSELLDLPNVHKTKRADSCVFTQHFVLDHNAAFIQGVHHCQSQDVVVLITKPKRHKNVC